MMDANAVGRLTALSPVTWKSGWPYFGLDGNHDQTVDSTHSVSLTVSRVWLRVRCDFLTEEARFSYSIDGITWTNVGRPFTMAFQLKTFQGVRYALFHYNTSSITNGT